jgi:hypothetical protein
MVKLCGLRDAYRVGSRSHRYAYKPSKLSASLNLSISPYICAQAVSDAVGGRSVRRGMPPAKITLPYPAFFRCDGLVALPYTRGCILKKRERK